VTHVSNREIASMSAEKLEERLAELQLETTADGNKGESEGRDQREKAFLRVDDKK